MNKLTILAILLLFISITVSINVDMNMTNRKELAKANSIVSELFNEYYDNRVELDRLKGRLELVQYLYDTQASELDKATTLSKQTSIIVIELHRKIAKIEALIK